MDELFINAILMVLASLFTNLASSKISKLFEKRFEREGSHNIIIRNKEGEALSVSVSKVPKDSEIVKIQSAIDALNHKDNNLKVH